MTMRISDLPPTYREIAQQKAAAPGATTVSSGDARAVFEQYVAKNRIPLTGSGYVDMQQATIGVDYDLFRQAQTLQEFAQYVEKGDVFVPAPRERLIDKLFGRIFASTPRAPSNTEGLPGGRSNRTEPASSLDWLNQVDSIQK